MKSLMLFLAIYCPLASAQAGTGNATSTGSCSPAVSGNNNTFTIKCEGTGIDDKTVKNIVALLNSVLAREPDRKIVTEKLDAILNAVQNIPGSRDEARNKKLREALGVYLQSGTALFNRCRTDPPESKLPTEIEEWTSNVETWLSANLGSDSVAEFQAVQKAGMPLMKMTVERSDLWFVMNQRLKILMNFIDKLK